MALYKYHYIELDTKRSPRISLQNIVAGETGNVFWITFSNNNEIVDMSEKSDGEFLYRVSLRIRSNLGVRRQDSDDPDGGITFIEAQTGDHGKIHILLSADAYTSGKNRCVLEIYSKRVEEDDTLICSAEWTFSAEENPTGENKGLVYPMMAYYEQLAKSWATGGTGKREGEDIDNAMYFKTLAEQAVRGGIIDPTFATWLNAHLSDFLSAISGDADKWLAEHITNLSNPPLDTSLSLSNAAAPANLLGFLVNYLGASVYRSDKKTATTTYNAIIKSNGNIEASTSSSAHLSIYPVDANKLYVLYGLSVRVPSTATALAVYSTSLFDGETTLTGNTIVVPSTTAATLTNYNVTFRPTSDGYIYIYSYGNYNALELYDGVYRSTTLDNISVSIKPSESYDVSFDDIFNKYESAFIDDFTARESFVDADHPYTILGSDADAPTITTGTGATRTGASGMATLAYSRTFDSFPYICLIGRVASAAQIVKVFDDSNSLTAGAISIGVNGGVMYNGDTYGNIHINAAYVVLVINSDSVTVYDDSGIEVRIPVSYTSDKPMNIALGFGANVDRLFGYGSFVEFVKRPMQTLDFNRCVALNEGADSLSSAKSVIRFTHGIWSNNSAVATVYYKPSDNPYMESVQGLSNNPCIKCVCDYSEDNGYRTEIGITPVKGSLKGKIGGLQRFRTSADYYMASADNPGTNDFYTYIFQLHDANFAVQGWRDGPPFTLRVYNGKLSAHVCYIDNGAVPQGDNVHTVNSYDLCDWEMDKWHHIEVEARIGWRNVLAPRLIVRVDGIERLNIETPLGYNIVSSGGYVNTHFGNYVPQWHDAAYTTKHSEVIVTNIRWEGTQNVN